MVEFLASKFMIFGEMCASNSSQGIYLINLTMGVAKISLTVLEISVALEIKSISYLLKHSIWGGFISGQKMTLCPTVT